MYTHEYICILVNIYSPVSNIDDSAGLELAPNGLLDLCISLWVNISCGLINADHLGPHQQCSGQAHQLTLTC